MILGFKDQYQFKSKLLVVYNKIKTCYYLVHQNYYIYPSILQQLIDSYLSLKYSVFITTIAIYYI